MNMAGWLHPGQGGGDDTPHDDVPAGPAETFAVQALYRRYGQRIYARAAADPAFSAAIASQEEAIREEMLRIPRRWTKVTRKAALNGYLLGHAHALLQELLEAAVDAEASGTSATLTGGDWVMVRLGALFQLAFAEGLLTLREPDHR